jgi:hypothetical protein
LLGAMLNQAPARWQLENHRTVTPRGLPSAREAQPPLPAARGYLAGSAQGRDRSEARAARAAVGIRSVRAAAALDPLDAGDRDAG